jgi:hypothetical protein
MLDALDIAIVILITYIINVFVNYYYKKNEEFIQHEEEEKIYRHICQYEWFAQFNNKSTVATARGYKVLTLNTEIATVFDYDAEIKESLQYNNDNEFKSIIITQINDQIIDEKTFQRITKILNEPKK